MDIHVKITRQRGVEKLPPSTPGMKETNNKTKRASRTPDHRKKVLIIQVLLSEDWVETGDFAWKTSLRPKPVIKIMGRTKKNFELFVDQLNELEKEKIIISKEDESKPWRLKPTIYSLNKENWETVLFIYGNIPRGQNYILNNDWAFELLYNQKIKGISDKNVKSDIGNMLKLSQTFFRFAMNFSNLKEVAQLYYEYSILYKFEVLDPLKPELKKILLAQKQKYAFHELFLFCVFCDRIKNPDDSTAFTFLREIKNRSAREEVSNLGQFSLNLEFLTIQAIFNLQREKPRKIQELQNHVETCEKLINHLNIEPSKSKFRELINTFRNLDDILGVNKKLNEQYFMK